VLTERTIPEGVPRGRLRSHRATHPVREVRDHQLGERSRLGDRSQRRDTTNAGSSRTKSQVVFVFSGVALHGHWPWWGADPLGYSRSVQVWSGLQLSAPNEHGTSYRQTPATKSEAKSLVRSHPVCPVSRDYSFVLVGYGWRCSTRRGQDARNSHDVRHERTVALSLSCDGRDSVHCGQTSGECGAVGAEHRPSGALVLGSGAPSSSVVRLDAAVSKSDRQLSARPH
jgi:hypothetical protein